LIRRIKAARKLLGDKAYDSADLRQWPKVRGTEPVIPNRSNRKQSFSFDKKSRKQQHRIENAFARLRDFRRIATRYDRLARDGVSGDLVTREIRAKSGPYSIHGLAKTFKSVQVRLERRQY
jgi:transposase